MSDSKKAPEQWRAQQMRAERKARLAKMKAKDGVKKQIRTSNPAARLVVILILVVALLITAVWAVIRSGVPHRSLAALTVGSEKLLAVELNYYYYMQLSNYGLDPSDPDSQATLRAASGIEGFKTNADYLKDQAAQQLRSDVMLADQARKNGFTLSEENKTLIETYLTNLQSAATQAKVTLDNYLITTYGSGTTVDTVRPVVERMLLADQYATYKTESFTFTEEALQEAYAADKASYDVVTYRIFYLAADIKTGATDAEKTKAMEEAKTRAQAMLAAVSDGESFRLACIEYAAEADKEKYTTSDLSLQRQKHKSEVYVTAQSSWLFDTARKANDKTLLDSTSGYYLLLLETREKPTYRHIDVRHILISAARATATAEQVKTAEEKAKSILADYLAGAKTGESFGELAKTHTADSNGAAGGLYTGVKPGDMVSEFNDWCFDPARQPGDTGIVQTDYGFHVMYFVDYGDTEDWAINVTTLLRDQAYSAYVEEELKNYPYKLNSAGMRFVG